MTFVQFIVSQGRSLCRSKKQIERARSAEESARRVGLSMANDVLVSFSGARPGIRYSSRSLGETLSLAELLALEN